MTSVALGYKLPAPDVAPINPCMHDQHLNTEDVLLIPGPSWPEFGVWCSQTSKGMTVSLLMSGKCNHSLSLRLLHAKICTQTNFHSMQASSTGTELSAPLTLMLHTLTRSGYGGRSHTHHLLLYSTVDPR